MTENIARVNDFDKGSITLELPGSLHEAFSELSEFSGDLRMSITQIPILSGLRRMYLKPFVGSATPTCRRLPRTAMMVPAACSEVSSGRSSNIWLSSGNDGRCDWQWPEGTFPVALTDENP